MITPEQISELLLNYHPQDSAEAEFREKMLALALAAPDCCWRSRLEGHFTASAWVLNAKRDQVLLIHHRSLRRWLQPGGHLEKSDLSLSAAALREVAEECGVRALQPVQEGIFDLDIHPIPEKPNVPAHLHYDVRFAFIAENERVTPDFSEVNSVQWVPLAGLAQDGALPDSLRRMLEKVV